MGNRTVTVTIAGDSRGAVAAFRELGDHAEGLQHKLGSVAKGIAAGFTVGAGAAALFGKSAIDAASDLNETTSKIGVLFSSTGAGAKVSAQQFADSVTANNKASEELAKVTEKVAQKMGDLREKNAERARASAEKIRDAEDDLAEKVKAAAERKAGAHERYRDAVEAASGKVAAAQEKEKAAQEAAADVVQRARDKIIDAQQRQQDVARDTAAAAQAARDKIVDAEQRKSDAQADYADAAEDARTKVVEAEARIADAAKDAAAKIADAKEAAAEVAERSAERIADAEATAAERAESAAERQADARERAAERQEQAAQKVADAAAALAEAQADPKRAGEIEKLSRRLQDAREDEAKTAARAAKDIAKVDRDAAKSAEDAAKAVERAKKDGAKAVEDANDRVTKAEADGAKSVETASKAADAARKNEQDTLKTRSKAVEDAAKAVEKAKADEAKVLDDNTRKNEDAAKAVAKAHADVAKAQEDAAKRIADAAKAVEKAKADETKAHQQAAKDLRDAESGAADGVEDARKRVAKARADAAKEAQNAKKDEQELAGELSKARNEAATAAAAVAANQKAMADSHKAMAAGAGVANKAVMAELEKFADSAAKNYGQSKAEAYNSIATFSQFGKIAGLTGNDLAKFSTKMTGLSSDLASFHNANPAEVVEALGAAFRGEAEPARRFGVMLNDNALKAKAMELGLYAGKGALEDSAKVQAAYALILDQTKDAQGDFARTSDGLANKQRILSASVKDITADFGVALLPVALKVATALSTMVERVGPLATSISQHLGPALQHAAEWIGKVVHVFGSEGLDGILARLPGPLRDIAGSFVAFGRNVDDVFRGTVAVVRAFWELFGDDIVRTVRGVFDGIAQVIRGVVTVFSGVIETIRGIFTGDWSRVWDGLKDVVSGAITALEGALKGIGAVVRGALGGVGEIAQEVLERAFDFAKWVALLLPKIPVELAKLGVRILEWMVTDLPAFLAGKAVDLGGTVLGFVADLVPKIPVELAKLSVKFGEWLVVDLPASLAQKAVGLGGKVVGFIGGFADDIPDQLAKWVTQVVAWVKGFPSHIASGLTAAGDVGEKVVGFIGGFATHIPDQLAKWAAKVVEWIGKLPDHIAAVAGGAAKLGGKVVGFIGDFADDIPSQLAKWAAEFVKWIGGLPAAAKKGFEDLADDIANWIVGGIKKGITSLPAKAGSAIKDAILPGQNEIQRTREQLGGAYDVITRRLKELGLEGGITDANLKKVADAIKRAGIEGTISADDMKKLKEALHATGNTTVTPKVDTGPGRASVQKLMLDLGDLDDNDYSPTVGVNDVPFSRALAEVIKALQVFASRVDSSTTDTDITPAKRKMDTVNNLFDIYSRSNPTSLVGADIQPALQGLTRVQRETVNRWVLGGFEAILGANINQPLSSISQLQQEAANRWVLGGHTATFTADITQALASMAQLQAAADAWQAAVAASVGTPGGPAGLGFVQSNDPATSGVVFDHAVFTNAVINGIGGSGAKSVGSTPGGAGASNGITSGGTTHLSGNPLGLPSSGGEATITTAGGTFSGTLEQVATYLPDFGSLPAAAGAVLRRPTRLLAGEYPGAATNPEIVTPESLMADTMRGVLAEQRNTGPPIVINKIEIHTAATDAHGIAEAVYDELRKIARRNGHVTVDGGLSVASR